MAHKKNRSNSALQFSIYNTTKTFSQMIYTDPINAERTVHLNISVLNTMNLEVLRKKMRAQTFDKCLSPKLH